MSCCSLFRSMGRQEAYRSLIASPNTPSVDLEAVFFSSRTAILLIDFQKDFLEGGSLPVPKATYDTYALAMCEFVARCRARPNLYITQSQDWHPAGHSSFASSHKGQAPFSTKILCRPSGNADDDIQYEQTMWPDHCVQGSAGAELLIEPLEEEYVQRKGQNMHVDSYSAFFDLGDATTHLDEHLRDKGIDTVVICGVASDYCVKFSAMDAVKCGFTTICVQDLCRGVDPQYDIVAEYSAMGVACVKSTECYKYLPNEMHPPSRLDASDYSTNLPNEPLERFAVSN
eukprot:GEMP01019518.1.p1 GENE.GEMP01019518.1~~GEMP01019518.1.p1  ORF type:complete len:286 (+),score=65.72 GEMP01019518.1:66-923(+)